AIGRGGCVHDRGCARLIEAGGGGDRRVEGGERGERAGPGLSRGGGRPVAAPGAPNRGAGPGPPPPPRPRAPPPPHPPPRIPAPGARDLRDIGPGEQRAGGEQQLAAAGSVQTHAHLLWNSGAMNKSAKACGLLSARLIACRVSAEAMGASVCSNTSRGSAWP